jgi:hypothetical protein
MLTNTNAVNVTTQRTAQISIMTNMCKESSIRDEQTKSKTFKNEDRSCLNSKEIVESDIQKGGAAKNEERSGKDCQIRDRFNLGLHLLVAGC